MEGIQYKSCDNITRGVEPDSSSQGILKLGKKKDEKKTIWGEFNKVIDSPHKRFYQGLDDEYKFTLFVVSNKPLKDYDEIRNAMQVKEGKVIEKMEEKQKKKKNLEDYLLPKGVVVVCHQNFQAYAGSFAHHGLYLPLKRKREDSDEEDTKKQKIEDEM